MRTALPLKNVGTSSSLKVFSRSSLLGWSVCWAMGPLQYTLPWQNRLMNTPSGATHNNTPLSRWQRRRFIASAMLDGRDMEFGEGKESCWAVQRPYIRSFPNGTQPCRIKHPSGLLVVTLVTFWPWYNSATCIRKSVYTICILGSKSYNGLANDMFVSVRNNKRSLTWYSKWWAQEG